MENAVTTATFKVCYTRYLNKAGELIRPLPENAQDPAVLIAPYGALVRTRAFDAKVGALQRTRRLGTYACSLGLEAVIARHRRSCDRPVGRRLAKGLHHCAGFKAARRLAIPLWCDR